MPFTVDLGVRRQKQVPAFVAYHMVTVGSVSRVSRFQSLYILVDTTQRWYSLIVCLTVANGL